MSILYYKTNGIFNHLIDQELFKLYDPRIYYISSTKREKNSNQLYIMNYISQKSAFCFFDP